MRLLALLAACVFVSPSYAAVVYTADFSIAGQGATHDNSGNDQLEASPIVGANWVLSYDVGAINSDGTTNEFITTGGLMRVQDWGGNGTVTSSVINITTPGTATITGAGVTIGGDAFNSVGNEGITWFYSLNAAPPVTNFLGETELGGVAVPQGTDVGNVFNGIAVSNGDTLEVGFTVNVDGAGDGVEISSLIVDVTAVPEPSSFAVFAALGFGYVIRRRKSKSA